MDEISKSPKTRPEARYRAAGFIEGLSKFETVLTAQIFLRIFKITTSLSKYLQTSGIDILQAHRMVVNSLTRLRECSRDFNAVKSAAEIYVSWANEKLHSVGSAIEISDHKLGYVNARRCLVTKLKMMLLIMKPINIG